MRFEIPAIAAAVDQVMSQQLTGLQAHLGPLGDDTRSVPSETSAPQEATADDSEAPTFDEEFESLTDED
jgi:hypothetical protein